MTPGLFKQTEAMMRDAEEMRAFYQSVGISAETIERALAARHGLHPAPEPVKGRTAKVRGRKKKLSV